MLVIIFHFDKKGLNKSGHLSQNEKDMQISPTQISILPDSNIQPDILRQFFPNSQPASALFSPVQPARFPGHIP